MEDELKQTTLAKLLAPPSKESLLELIRWLDLECATALPESLQMQILARSIVAAGYELVKKQVLPADHPVVKTIRAAERYALEPTEANYEHYFDAATDSYPFGPGDGCLAVEELGYPGCEPGSGCVSGAGSLYQAALKLGSEVVMQSVKQELIPWLQGETDPIVLRVKT